MDPTPPPPPPPSHAGRRHVYAALKRYFINAEGAGEEGAEESPSLTTVYYDFACSLSEVRFCPPPLSFSHLDFSPWSHISHILRLHVIYR